MGWVRVMFCVGYGLGQRYVLYGVWVGLWVCFVWDMGWVRVMFCVGYGLG